MSAIRIGTRASALAMWQTRHVVDALAKSSPDLEVELVPLSTSGDELIDAPLERMEGTGFFTSTLERALLDGTIDLAVHSMKDMPTAPTAGLEVAAVLQRGPVEDALCARHGWTLDRLPRGATIGSSSPRRTAQLRLRRPDLRFVSLRGNVGTRLDRVARGELDGAMLARAGLERLGLIDRATEIFPVTQILPAPAQGAIAVQARAGDRACDVTRALDHAATRRAALTERAVLHRLRGGCSVPVGAFAVEIEGRLRLDAGVFEVETGFPVRIQRSGSDPVELGTSAADWLLAHGADRILADLDRAPRVMAGESR